MIIVKQDKSLAKRSIIIKILKRGHMYIWKFPIKDFHS